jgi:hypothetical protein
MEEPFMVKQISKNILSLALSLLLICSLFAVGSMPAVAAEGQSLKITTPIKSYTLQVGSSLTLPVAFQNGQDPASGKPAYRSANKKVVTVSANGKMTAKKTGKTVVTISIVGATSVKIKVAVVKKQSKVKKLTVTGAPATMEAGKATKITAKLSPASATNANIRFSSSSKAVVSVDKAGVLYAWKPGTAVITTKVGAKSVKKTIKVTASAAAGLSAAPYTVTVPALSYGTNFVVLETPKGIAGYRFSLGGNEVTPTPILADYSFVKIPLAEGQKEGHLKVDYGRITVLETNVSFPAALKAPAKNIYGQTAMRFSEFFHDVTAKKPLSYQTAFVAGGAVDEPKQFITAGTRTGASIGGVSSRTYAESEAMGLPGVDAVSTATYGDSVHFPPNGNLILAGGNRMEKTNPDAAITGIKSVDVAVPYDLFANATILKQAGKATEQSANVIEKLDKNRFTLQNVETASGLILDPSGAAVPAASVYKAKTMLTDGNFGSRVSVNDNAAQNLPGTGNAGVAEDVAYGGNWGDIVTGFSFGDAAALTAEYTGANYWDNFANNIYGGVITDSSGHSEPLVFLQNLFSHRMHTDFDVALSPSRFARLKNLNYPDTYRVQVFADGFKDVEFSFSAKKYENANAALAAPCTISSKAGDTSIILQGIENPIQYAVGAKLYLGNNTLGRPVAASSYTLSPQGGDRVKLTIKAAALTGVWWGTSARNTETTGLTLYSPETDRVAGKAINLALTNGVTPSLSLTAGGAALPATTQTAPLTVSQTEGTLHLLDEDFAKVLSTSTSTIRKTTDPATNAVPAGDVLQLSGGAGSPYVINLSSAAITAGNTYVLTLNAATNAANCTAKVYYINVTA